MPVAAGELCMSNATRSATGTPAWCRSSWQRVQRDHCARVNGTRRRLRSVFGSFTRPPAATTRRTCTTAASRSMSRCSNPASSAGRKPVSLANTTIGPKSGPSSAATRSTSSRVNGSMSRRRATRRFPVRASRTGLSRMIFQATARSRLGERPEDLGPVPVGQRRLPGGDIGDASPEVVEAADRRTRRSAVESSRSVRIVRRSTSAAWAARNRTNSANVRSARTGPASRLATWSR